MSSFASLRELCEVSRSACTIMRPMIKLIYDSISSETSKLKADASAFTIADGVVQHLLVNYLFSGDKFAAVVGEEDESNVNIVTKPFVVDDLVIPDSYVDIIESTRIQIEDLSKSICGTSYKHLSVFIDPIDGTREFSTKLGEQCSVCIGFSDTEGLPVGGLVYRPITEPPTWAAGAKSENYADHELDMATTPNVNGLLTTNGSISPFTVQMMAHCQLHRVPSGGAGNKMLMLLEGKGGAYIQDRGVSRWDTCGAQAVIEAHGGILCKLTSFLDDKSLESYKYLQSSDNLDFIPGRSNLTPYNARNKSSVPKGAVVIAQQVNEVKPYSNLCGLLALHSSCLHSLDMFYEGMKKAEATEAPGFD